MNNIVYSMLQTKPQCANGPIDWGQYCVYDGTWYYPDGSVGSGPWGEQAANDYASQGRTLYPEQHYWVVFVDGVWCVRSCVAA